MHESLQPKLRILGAGAYHGEKDVPARPHSHSYWELVYYRYGMMNCLLDGESFPGHPGLSWLTPPQMVHADQAVTAYGGYYIGIDIEGTTDWPIFLDDADGSLGRICQQIAIESRHNSKIQTQMLGLLAEQLGYILERVASDRSLTHPLAIVTKAERLIEEGCTESFDIQAIARAVHVSPSSLRKYFKTFRGYSQRDYLHQVRLLKAISLLRTSTLKLEAIAELCGYNSASHLTRSIKESTGKTPGHLRENLMNCARS